MQRISQAEYEATHRICNYVESLIGPYYGRRTLGQAMEFVSQNRWIMFPVNKIDSLRQGAEMPMPNVFLSVEDVIDDQGTGKLNGWVGFSYHNVDAMQALHAILQRKSKEQKLMNLLASLDDEWKIVVQTKTKTDCPDSTPKYDDFKEFEPSTVTADAIRDAIAKSNGQLLHRGDAYPKTGNPVLWSVTIFGGWKEIDFSTFDDDVKTAFKVFFELLKLA